MVVLKCCCFWLICLVVCCLSELVWVVWFICFCLYFVCDWCFRGILVWICLGWVYYFAVSEFFVFSIADLVVGFDLL